MSPHEVISDTFRDVKEKYKETVTGSVMPVIAKLDILHTPLVSQRSV